MFRQLAGGVFIYGVATEECYRIFGIIPPLLLLSAPLILVPERVSSRETPPIGRRATLVATPTDRRVMN
jgi:hypothetical protein